MKSGRRDSVPPIVRDLSAEFFRNFKAYKNVIPEEYVKDLLWRAHSHGEHERLSEAATRPRKKKA